MVGKLCPQRCLVLTNFLNFLQHYQCMYNGVKGGNQMFWQLSKVQQHLTLHYWKNGLPLFVFLPSTYIPRLRWIDPASNFLPDTMDKAREMEHLQMYFDMFIEFLITNLATQKKAKNIRSRYLKKDWKFLLLKKKSIKKTFFGIFNS